MERTKYCAVWILKLQSWVGESSRRGASIVVPDHIGAGGKKANDVITRVPEQHERFAECLVNPEIRNKNNRGLRLVDVCLGHGVVAAMT